jgi:hypothetical protein
LLVKSQPKRTSEKFAQPVSVKAAMIRKRRMF